MAGQALRLSPCGFLCVLVAASCGLDDRPLNYEYRALEAAGSSAGAGNGTPAGDAGAPAVGDAGSAAAGSNRVLDDEPGNAGSGPEGGSANMAADGGARANANGGVSANANAGSAGTGGTLSGAAGGVAASGAGSAAGGSAGAVFNGPCGDLNHNLVDDCTETLVQNSRFDISLAGWDAEPSLTETWSNENASGKPGSGSISLTQTGLGATMIGTRQCIAVTPNGSYDIAARVQVGTGQIGTAGVNVYFYDDAACQGNFMKGETPIEGGVAGSWTELATTVPLWVPDKAYSMYVRLFANKPPFQTAPLTVLIDDVLVAKRVMP